MELRLALRLVRLASLASLALLALLALIVDKGGLTIKRDFLRMSRAIWLT